MKCEIIQVGSFEVNCSIIVLNNRALVIDPGQEADRIVSVLKRLEAVPAGFLLTHGHFDHIGGLPDLVRTFPDVPTGISEADRPMLGHPMNQFPPDYPSFTFNGRLVSPDAFQEEFGYEVLTTPGHTPGGVSYYFPREKWLFSGDTLFAGSVGRTDFPGGNMSALMASLEELKKLPPETRVIPGHGSETTMDHECEANPFFG